MSDSFDVVYSKLIIIYNRHRRKYRYHRDTKQMCLMWSTNNPPDTICDTKPIYDIMDAFNIDIDELVAFELYDMNLDEAAQRIIQIQKTS